MTSHQQDNCVLKCTSVFELLYNKCLPADGSCGPKHVALLCCDLLDSILSFVYFRLCT